uniref:Uncharacterized protein n=1 Tax=Arundo donax TaxID=35708 RepID=A0A0A9B6R0_ARUDO
MECLSAPSDRLEMLNLYISVLYSISFSVGY